MALANEQDVVIAFRQAVEEEMRRAQSNPRRSIAGRGGHFAGRVGADAGGAHLELEHEVALLRTIILRLISEPVDEPEDEPGKCRS
jgi:hypothetical protein